jgi:hypothetical protein
MSAARSNWRRVLHPAPAANAAACVPPANPTATCAAAICNDRLCGAQLVLRMLYPLFTLLHSRLRPQGSFFVARMTLASSVCQMRRRNQRCIGGAGPMADSGGLLGFLLSEQGPPPGDDLSNVIEARNTGVLPYQKIAAMVRARDINSIAPVEPDQIQPASLDLRLGRYAYRVRASFLPGQNATVMERLRSWMASRRLIWRRAQPLRAARSMSSNCSKLLV